MTIQGIPDSDVIETRRLVLRQPMRGDLDDLAAILGDAEVMRRTRTRVPLAREEVAAALQLSIDRYELDGFGMYTMIRKEDGRTIGRAGFSVYDERWRRLRRWTRESTNAVEVGVIVASDARTKGYGPEAVFALRDHGFGSIGFPRLVALAQPGHTEIQRVAAALGMALEFMATVAGVVQEIWAVDRSVWLRNEAARTHARSLP